MRISGLSTVSFQSKLPPKQQKEIEPPKYWKVWGKDSWEELALDCEKKGKSAEFFKYLNRISKNCDNGILMLDKDVSNWGVYSYNIGLYHNLEDLEKDRTNTESTIRHFNTKNGNKYISLIADTRMLEASLENTVHGDKPIDLKGAKNITEALLYILKKIATPGSKEFKHLGFEFEPRILKELNKFRIK